MKKKGYIAFSTLLIYVLFIMAFSTGVYGGGLFVTNMRVTNLVTQCSVIDSSLEGWSKSHTGVDVASITYENDKTHFTKKRLYPETLSELGIIQNMGYFSRSTIDLSQFRYITLDDGTSYVLEVNLPNGSVFQSPGSHK